MPKKTADQWFAEYGESHQDHANELIHWICVPLIFFSVMGFVWEIPISLSIETTLPWFNWSIVAIVLATLFYAWLSLPLAVGMFSFMALCQTIHIQLGNPFQQTFFDRIELVSTGRQFSLLDQILKP